MKTKYAPRSEQKKADLRLGASIAKQLTPLRSAEDVGAELGLSRQAVQYIEQLALAKLARRMMALRTAGEV